MDPNAPRRHARLLFEIANGDTEVPLGDGVLSFGADPTCIVQIQGVGVAPHHAIIQWSGEGFDLVDLMSPGGTRVNGYPITSHRLRSGDLVAIGNAQFHFVEGVPQSAQDHTTRATLGAAGATPQSIAGEASAAGPRYVIVVPTRNASALLMSLVLHALIFFALTHLATPERPRPVFGDGARFDGSLASPNNDRVEAPLMPATPFPAVPTTPEPVIVPAMPAPSNAVRPTVTDVPLPSGRSSGQGLGGSGDQGEVTDGIGSAGGAGSTSGSGTADLGDGAGGFGDVRPIPGTPKLREYATGLREKGLDVVFAIDTTGSMGPVLSEARARVNSIIMVLSAIVPKFRLGIVAYRDTGDAYVVKRSKLTPHHWEAVRFLDSLEPGGGGDTPEAVLAALRDAIRNFPWAPQGARILIVVGDAPPHPREQSETESIARVFHRERGLIHTISCSALSTGSDTRLLKSAFGKLSAAGGGRALDLGQGASLAATLLPAIFGEEFVADMQQAVEEVTTGLRARVARRLAEEGTPADIDAELRRMPPRNEFLAALAQVQRPDRLGVYLDVLGDPTAPLASRWASATFAARTVRNAKASLSTQGLFDNLAPDVDPLALRDAVATARSRALAEGFRIPNARPGK